MRRGPVPATDPPNRLVYALFAREQEARTRDEADLKWLAEEWNPGA